MTKTNYGDVADYFIAFANETGDQLTNLKLQKLVYYAQAWYLANKGEPLFNEEFEAWVHGPVLPQLYRQYKSNGFKPIQRELSLTEVSNRFDPDTLQLLEAVAQVYMQYGAYQMELMTHQEEPWVSARKGIEPDVNSKNIIDKEVMRKFYAQRLES